MKTARPLAFLLAVACLTATVFAADPAGTWKWTTTSPAGEINTTLELRSKDGQLTGAYSNQFGDTSIRNAALHGDILTFEVVRDFNGSEFVIKYHGKVERDTITGTLETPNPDGGEPIKLDWHAKRGPQPQATSAKAGSADK